jgi:hypothetical protein
MRLAAVVLACLVIAPSADAATKSKRPQSPQSRKHTPRKALSDAQRGKLAVAAVKRSLTPWVARGQKVTIRPAIVQFDGDPRNPITGAGPVEVFVTQEAQPSQSWFRRVLWRFNSKRQEQYLVHVGPTGDAQILERLSLAPQRRFARFLANHVPLTSLFLDFYKSDRASEGLWTAIGAIGVAPVNLGVSGALFLRLAQVVREGVTSENTMRKKALDSTVAWVQKVRRREGAYPTLMATYRAYKGSVEDQQSGARSLSIGEFAEALSIREL